jgi:hypothetical protein
MRDKFRRLLGLKPDPGLPPAPPAPAPLAPAPLAPASSRPAPQPASPPASRPGPTSNAQTPAPETKPVHSVSEKKTGRSGTEPLVARPDPGAPNARQQAEQYLQRLQVKVNQLADDFAEGAINRDQFQKLYEHYQRERRAIENLLAADSKDEELQSAMGEGQSIVIRKQHLARALGYSIYENDSGMPIKTLGRFELDPALVVPMLSSFRAAAEEIFGGGIRSTEIEGGRWLCFVPGEITTLLAVFTNEPAEKQLAYIEDLHRLFEKANRRKLTRTPIEAASLLFPHEFFLK